VALLGLPLVPAGLVWGICWGMQETVYMSLAMHFSRGPWAATFFALAMIFSNVGTAIGEALAAPMAGELGYQTLFLFFAAISAALAVFSRFTLKIKKPG
jgi:predicted MFS family arabinose efflux permease